MPDLKEPGLGMECSNLAPNIGSSQTSMQHCMLLEIEM